MTSHQFDPIPCYVGLALSVVALIIQEMELFMVCFSGAILGFLFIVWARRDLYGRDPGMWNCLAWILIIWFGFNVIITFQFMLRSGNEFIDSWENKNTCGITLVHIISMVRIVIYILMLVQHIVILVCNDRHHYMMNH